MLSIRFGRSLESRLFEGHLVHVRPRRRLGNIELRTRGVWSVEGDRLPVLGWTLVLEVPTLGQPGRHDRELVDAGDIGEGGVIGDDRVDLGVRDRRTDVKCGEGLEHDRGMARDRDVVVAEADDGDASANHIHNVRDTFGRATRIELRSLPKFGEAELGRHQFVNVIPRPGSKRLVMPDSREEAAERGTVEIDHAIQRSGETRNGSRSTRRTRSDIPPT